VRVARICLHVGPGTFRPITGAIDDHRMLAEPFEIGARAAAALSRARNVGARICPVGTTSVRTLEAAARVWKAPQALSGEADLFIRPGFGFQLTDRLLTNFHLPRSTPLLLVAAFTGADLMLKAYRHALRSGYRFYSYGDAMLVL
jgi:S-adenosylmethionine:tRNA ribosyltransferase-isomerase